jgi:hypothetical protein
VCAEGQSPFAEGPGRLPNSYFPREWGLGNAATTKRGPPSTNMDSRFGGNDMIRGVQRGEALLRSFSSPMNGGQGVEETQPGIRLWVEEIEAEEINRSIRRRNGN